MEKDQPIGEFTRFAQILQDEIIPLLEEYCYEDYSAMADILGNGLVDSTNQAVRQELFDDSRRSDLIQALLEPYPEIATSRQAVASEARAETDTIDEGEDSEKGQEGG